MKNNIFQFIKAILLIIVSILLLVKPGESLVMLASYLGAISLIFGIISIINKYRSERIGVLSSKTYFEGLVAIAFGIIFLSNPENMIKFIVVFFGIMTFIVSIIQFSLYRNLEKSNIRSYFLLSTAILSMIIALVMFFNPFSSAELLAMIIGFYVLIYGVILLLRAMRLFQDTI
jgi:uncharacterized membrane protein HdeD (DUF308 family)